MCLMQNKIQWALRQVRLHIILLFTYFLEHKPKSKENEDENFIVRPLILAGIICGAGLILVVLVSVLLYVRHRRRSGGGR